MSGVRYLDVCAGISASTVAWSPLGWKAVAYSEIEAAPRAVLSHHYPDVPLHGDFTTIKGDEYGPVDLLVGGTPCQDFSVAGLRKGLAGDRGNLTLEFLRLADRVRPRWLVWENVPGVLSIDGGRAFGAFLGGLGQLGYGFAYRVLDAQHFGVPQRRRRVFVVGCAGDWRRAAAVLLERHGLSGHPAPRRETGQRVAGTLKACAGKSGTPNGAEEADRLVIAPTLTSNGDAHSGYRDERGLVPVAFGGQMSTPMWDFNLSQTLQAKNPQAVAFGGDTVRSLTARHDSSPCADRGMDVVAVHSAVRRLTPRECERLQGFPDDYTLVPHRGKPMADGPRYKALGNSMAVPCMLWLGQRIQAVENLTAEIRSAA